MTVAPHVGAWIETCRIVNSQGLSLSHPMWVRGLKRIFFGRATARSMSHPMWVRGLKRENVQYYFVPFQVAPHVGAWIETVKTNFSQIKLRKSHPMWVRGLKLRT